MEMNRVAVHSGPGEFHGKWCRFLEQEGVSVSRVNLPGRHAYDLIACCQGLMWHLPMAPSILQAAEPVLSPAEFVLGKKVFPNYATRWHFENKHAQKYLFDALGVATPATVCLWDREEARDWIETGAQFPLVYKKARGAGSRNVSLVRSKEQALGIVKKAFSPRGGMAPGRLLRRAGETPRQKGGEPLREHYAEGHGWSGPHAPGDHAPPSEEILDAREGRGAVPGVPAGKHP